MSVITYVLLAYGMTAVISFGVVAVIVAVNKLFSAPEGETDDG